MKRWVIFQTNSLFVVRKGPRKYRKIGNADFVTSHISVGFRELMIQDFVESLAFVHIALDRIGNFLWSILREMMVLSEHRAKACHLPIKPLESFVSLSASKRRQKACVLVGQIF